MVIDNIKEVHYPPIFKMDDTQTKLLIYSINGFREFCRRPCMIHEFSIMAISDETRHCGRDPEYVWCVGDSLSSNRDDDESLDGRFLDLFHVGAVWITVCVRDSPCFP